jgi:hypothetical protein
MYMHRDSIQKMLQWRNEFVSGRIQQDSADSYLVTFQYLLDNFLFDLHPLSRHQILHIPDDYNDEVVVLNGKEPHWRRIIPPEYTDYSLEERFLKSRGDTIFFGRNGRIIFALEPFFHYDPSTHEIVLYPLSVDREMNPLRAQKKND